MRYLEYELETTQEGLKLDKELSLEQIGFKAGDTFIVTEDKHGTIVFRKFDIDKFEHIEATLVEEEE